QKNDFETYAISVPKIPDNEYLTLFCIINFNVYYWPLLTKHTHTYEKTFTQFFCAFYIPYRSGICTKSNSDGEGDIGN
ncbi:hypothetical protein M8994_21960, partial [Brucella sp. 21LCYQ03]|nr:hypothetical protein [Brucella sp. 21LCYQ03]